MCLERDSNLGLSMSHRMNYEAVALTNQPPRLDKLVSYINGVSIKFHSVELYFLPSSIFT